LGTETEVEKVFVSGRDMEIDEARKLADFFHVDMGLFL
jgi:HTH-type transcriptional regulator / antitoxin HigA